MQERKINFNPGYKVADSPKDINKISGNFYPVDSAIAMRDPSKNRQVII